MSYDPTRGIPLIALTVGGAAWLWACFSQRAFDKKWNRDRD
jgi:hypothetical protein